MADKPLQSLTIQGLSDTYVNTPLSTAPTFDNTTAYAVGDYVFYNRKLYKFIASHSSGNWNSSQVEEVTIGNEIKEIKNDLSQKYTKPSTGIPASDLALGVIPEVPVQDIQLEGTSILSDGVANIPKASANAFGVVKNGTSAVQVNANGVLTLTVAGSSAIKTGTNAGAPIPVVNQHISTFYGLAKAAGDTTQSVSDNTVGTYTDSAKDAIKSMLGIDLASGNIQNVSGTTVTITGEPNARYICGEVATIDITPPATGTIIVRFTSGSTATVLTLPSTVKMPEWFDALSLEADTIYELSITDGVYGAVMSWAV